MPRRPVSQDRLDLTAPRHPRPTFQLLRYERDKRPSVVTVTNGDGTVIATIDPVTRTRRTPSGRRTGTLTPQGWNAATSQPYSGPSTPLPPRPDYGLHLKADRAARG